jgi:AhpD family alkylhydroperoxidase
MARIAPVAGRRTPLLLRLLNAASRRTVGAETAPLQVMAHNPGFLLPYVATLRLVRGRAALDPAVRALAMQLVAAINGCSWCLDFGRAEAEKGGVPAAKLLAVADYASDPAFSPAERAALAYADAVTQVGARVPDDVFGHLHCHYSDREIVELTAAVAMENFYNRINAPLGIEAQGFCAVPPLPTVAADAA